MMKYLILISLFLIGCDYDSVHQARCFEYCESHDMEVENLTIVCQKYICLCKKFLKWEMPDNLPKPNYQFDGGVK